MLGYNTELKGPGGGTVHGYRAIAGCSRPTNDDDPGCETQVGRPRDARESRLGESTHRQRFFENCRIARFQQEHFKLVDGLFFLLSAQRALSALGWHQHIRLAQQKDYLFALDHWLANVCS